MTRNEILNNLKGVICPIATPFDRRGNVDEGHFRENLSRLAGIGLGGILVSGSTGEAPYLTESERLRLVELAREVIRPPELLMVGTGLESTRATLNLSQEVVERGADVILVVTPNYFKPMMNTAALVEHYRTIGAGVKRPVMIYAIPQFTGLDVDTATIVKLSRLPNIVGLKESSGRLDYARTVLRGAGRKFLVTVGSANIFEDALAAGAVGAVLGMANFDPTLCVGLYQAFINRQAQQARDLQRRLAIFAQKITIPFGVPGVKVAMDVCGYHGGDPRPPLLPVGPKGKKQIAAALREAHAGLAA